MLKTYKLNEYEIPDAHPAANCLPWNLDGQDFTALIASVKSEFDSMKPVMVQAGTGLIIDGRRRLLACAIADVDPVMKDYDMTDTEVIEYVSGHELSRRNLTTEQYAAALVKLNDLKPVGANQHENKSNEGGSAEPPSKSVKEISDESGASKGSVKRLSELKKKAPALLDLVQEKKLPINTALRAAKELTPKQVKQIANSADPKAEAKKLLPAKPKREPKAKPAAPPSADPIRGGNNFDFGANAPEAVDVEPKETATEAEPDPLTDPDAFVAEMETICRQIDVYLKSIRHLEKSKYAKSVMLSTAIDQIEAARKQLWVNRPAFYCEYCHGNDQDCRACRGTGRLSKDAYKRACDALGKEAAA
jgi:hypothetical protein